MKWPWKGDLGRTVEPPKAPEPEPTNRPKRKASREETDQLSMRGDAKVVERFRRLCRADRRTYLEMLVILMDHFESPKPR